MPALHHTIEHARATPAAEPGTSSGGCASVPNDGVGLHPRIDPPATPGRGRSGERAGAAQAEMTIDSEPGAGTTATVRLREDGT